MTTNPTHQLDLHTELQNDTTGARRAEVLALLQARRDECIARRRQPADRDAYTRLQAATVALNAAIRIVEKVPQDGSGGNWPIPGVTQS